MSNGSSNILSVQCGFDAAVEALQAGLLVAVPTETVYGLAADATNASAVQAIYKAKGRPSFNPLIAHVSGLDMAQRYGRFNALALELAKRYWPGPLTIVVPLQGDHKIADEVTAGLDTIALRHPCGIMADLAHAVDAPLAAPSANTSGTISPTLASHVADDLGSKLAVIIDSGPCAIGLESTIVKPVDDGLVLLREGGISADVLEAAFGPLLRPNAETTEPTKVEAPGMLLAHYAPSVPVRLNAVSVNPGEALLRFGQSDLQHDGLTLNLSPRGDIDEAAHNLFAMLHELDRPGVTAIAVEPIAKEGLGRAINDRLTRAAQGRDEPGQLQVSAGDRA